jgi:toxin ParE1/3/4
VARYRLTRQADRRLEAIYRYTFENFGATQADAYFADLEEAFGLLAERPHLGRAFYQYRRFEHESHVIFYRPRRGGILIVDILHVRENTDKIGRPKK